MKTQALRVRETGPGGLALFRPQAEFQPPPAFPGAPNPPACTQALTRDPAVLYDEGANPSIRETGKRENDR